MSLSDARHLLDDAELAIEQSEQQLRRGDVVQALRMLDEARQLRERWERWAEAYESGMSQVMRETGNTP